LHTKNINIFHAMIVRKCFANEHACKAVINWIVTFGFTQFVTFPTRETSILDLVLCDKDQFIRDVSPSPPIGHSDHCVIDSSFYRAMLCIRGTSHGPVSVSVCHNPVFY